MGRPKIKDKTLWARVTNAWIIKKFKQSGCNNCGGEGFLKDEQGEPTAVCSCATLAFRRAGDEMIKEGRLRLKPSGGFEYKLLGEV